MSKMHATGTAALIVTRCRRATMSCDASEEPFGANAEPLYCIYVFVTSLRYVSETWSAELR